MHFSVNIYIYISTEKYIYFSTEKYFSFENVDIDYLCVAEQNIITLTLLIYKNIQLLFCI